ncbi:hypothetical protein JG688_00015120, partial [Phytophthora aleatoria]
DSDSQELEELCEAVDSPFRANKDDDEEVPGSEILGPSLLIREQRTRAAQLYKNVVSWSLRYAHLDEMPENWWIADVDKCVRECKYYLKFKTCCHILVGRKAKKLGRPATDDKTVQVPDGRPPLASRALDVQFTLCPDT